MADTLNDIYDDTPESERPGARRPAVGAPPDAPARSRRATDYELRGAYRALRAEFLAQCAARGAECFFGDGPIAYGLPHGDSRAATVHHTIAVAVRPDLEMETSLWAASHSLCNRIGQAAFGGNGGGSSDDDDVPDTGRASEAW